MFLLTYMTDNFIVRRVTINIIELCMDDMKQELSARYYTAEVTIWLLSAILIVARVIGLAPSQRLPVLGVTLGNSQHYLRIVAVLLILSFMYLFFEWLQSSLKARVFYWAKVRAGFTLLFTCTFTLVMLSAYYCGHPICGRHARMVS